MCPVGHTLFGTDDLQQAFAEWLLGIWGSDCDSELANWPFWKES